MASLQDLKRRRRSVENTQKITRAMKMVAAAKLRRAQEAIVEARPYAYRMRDIVSSLALRGELDLHPLLRQRISDGKVNILVVTSDRGLCGAFNANVVNTLMSRLQEDFAERAVELTVVGKKGGEMLKRRPVTIRKVHTGVMDESIIRAARNIVGDIIDEFSRNETDEVYCLYNEFKSAISQRVVLEKLLPFERPPAPENEPIIDYLYEPSVTDVFEGLLQRHMEVQLHRVLNESAASEYGARMTAMDSATKNAGEMIERVTLQINRARQDAITKELIEVVSGAEAL